MLKTMTASELKKRLEQRDVFLIDVREPAEYQLESIEGACLIPLSKIFEGLVPAAVHPIVIYCRSGHRSEVAGKKLLAEDPTLEIYNLEGGILAWKRAQGAI